MPLPLILYILSLTSSIVVGGMVYLQNSRDKINRVFSLFTVVVIAWISTVYFFSISKTPEQALIIDRLSLSSGILAVHLLFWFCYLFPRVTQPIKNYVHAAFIALSGVMVFLSSFSDLIERAIKFQNNVPYGYEYGPLFPLYTIYILILAAATIYLLSQKYRELKGLERLQITYLFSGISMGLVISLTLSLIVPAILAYTDISYYGLLGPVIMLSFVAYAIIRHRLFDIKIAVRSLLFKAATQLVIILLVFLIYSLVKPFADFNRDPTVLLFLIYASIIVLLIDSKLQQYVKKATDMAFPELKSREVTLEQFDHELAGILDFQSLLDYITGTLRKILGSVNVGYVFIETDGKSHKYEYFQADWAILTAEATTAIISYFDFRPRPLVLEELKREVTDAPDQLETDIPRAVFDTLSRLGVEVVLPLIAKRQVTGFILLGDKAEGYSSNDIEELRVISYPATLTFQNARLYAKQQKFNEQLQSKIDEATSELKATHAELRNSYDKLKTLDDMKSELIAVMSHELKTPLTTIKSYVWMLENQSDAPLSNKQKERLSIISGSAGRLLRIADASLVVSEIDNGKYILVPSPLDLYDLLEQVFAEYTSTATAKHITFNISPPSKPQFSAIYNGDKNKLHLLLNDLVDNAIKFTPEYGKVSLSLESGKSEFTVAILDTGLGIEGENIPAIFNKFSKRQAVYADTNSAGIGVGLYIADFIAKMHRGSIDVESNIGQGSKFTVHLPKSRSDKSPN